MCGEDMYVFTIDGEEEVGSLVGVNFGEKNVFEWNQ